VEWANLALTEFENWGKIGENELLKTGKILLWKLANQIEQWTSTLCWRPDNATTKGKEINDGIFCDYLLVLMEIQCEYCAQNIPQRNGHCRIQCLIWLLWIFFSLLFDHFPLIRICCHKLKSIEAETNILGMGLYQFIQLDTFNFNALKTTNL
jgi:hypothetical protein